MSNLESGNFPVLSYRNLDAQTTGSVVKSSRGGIFELTMSNVSAALRYVKIYDKATAPLSTDTPIRTYSIPIGDTVVVSVTDGIKFINGIGLRATTGIADNDVGAPTTNDVVVNIGYL